MSDAVVRSAALREAGRPVEALQVLMPHLAAQPDDVEALRQAGWAQLALNRTREARESAARAVALAPRSANQHLLMARVLARSNNLEAARRAAGEAVRLAPDSSVPHQVRVQVDLECDAVGRFTEEAARTAIRLDPHDADAHRLHGSVLLRMKRAEAARTALSEALRLDPSDAMARAELARADLIRGRSGAAAVSLSAQLRASPTDGILAFNLRVAVSNAFAKAQLVLWIGFLVADRLLWAADDPNLTLFRVAAPVLVAACLLMWSHQLRGARGGLPVLLSAVRRDRAVGIGLTLHAACLVLLLAGAVVPTGVGVGLLEAGGVALLGASVMTWVVRSRLKKARAAL